MTDSTAVPHLLLVAGGGPGGCLDSLGCAPDYTLDQASGTADALKLAARRRPSLIVIELTGYEQAGIDMCRAFATNHATRNVPILVIAGEPHASQFMIELTVKPCDTATLDREINRLIHRVH
jgi:DNA-binding response OmpR family regulator